MLSSGEIAAQFAAQNQFFLQQNQFAQQIGVAAPGTLAQMGSAPSMMHGPGATSFNYGGGMFNNAYGGGNRFASTIMSGVGAGAGIGGAALGIASHFGPLKALDPFISPMGAFGAARGAGMGMMGAAGVAALPMMAGMAVSHGISSFVGGAQAQSSINTTLGQNFNHFNPGSRSGMGFSREDSMAIGNQVRSLANLPEMMSSVDELTRIMGRMKQTGAMQGVKDVSEFQRRFRESLDVIKSTAQMLGTTMEEAQAFFSHNRSVGFFKQGDQLKNAMNAQLTSGLTGMSMGQVMQLQAGGASMATAMGARRSLGTKAVTNIAQQIGMAQREGGLQEGLLEDVTGLQGPEAVQAGAQQMAGLMSKMFQSSAGQLIGAGLVKYDAKGRAVGIDEDLAKRFNAGELSMQDLKHRASNLTQAQKISFRTRAADLGMSFAGTVGPGGMGRFMNEIGGGRFGSEGVNTIMQRYGATAGEADLAMSLQGMGAEGGMSQMSTQMSREGELANNSPGALLKRIKTRLHAATFGKVEQAGASAMNSLAKSYEEFIDDVVGRHVVTLSKRGADALERAMSGGNKQELHEMFSAASGMKLDYNAATAPGGYSVGSVAKGALGGIAASLTGGAALGLSSVGDRIKSAVDSSRFGGSLSETGFAESLRGFGNAGTTGRTELGQVRYMQGILGVKDIDGLGAKLKGIAGTRLDGVTNAAANSAFGSIRAGLGSDFDNADEAKRHEMLRSGLLSSIQGDLDGHGLLGMEKGLARGAINGFTALQSLGMAPKMGLTSAADLMDISADQMKGMSASNRALVQDMQARVRKGATPDEAMLQVMAGSGAIKVSGLANITQAKNIFTAAGREQAISTAKDALKAAGLDEETMGLIQSNPTMQHALEQALGGHSGIQEILNGDEIRDDPTAAVSKLAGMGVKVDAKDLPALKAAWSKMRQGDSTKMLGALKNFQAAKSSGDIDVIRQGFGKTGAAIAEALKSKENRLSDPSKALLSKLSGSLTTFSQTPTEENFKAAQGGLFAAQQEFLKLGKTQQAEVISASGSLGGTFTRTAAINKLRGSSMSAQDIAERLGIQGDQAMSAIENSGVAGTGKTKTKLTDSVIEKLIKNLGGDIAAKNSAQAGQQVDTGKDKLNTTLDDLKSAMDRTNDTNSKLATVIAANLTDDQFKKGKDRLIELKDTAKPGETKHD